MEKTTVLARLRFTIDFTEETYNWLQDFPDMWFAREGGGLFLAEHGSTWRSTIEAITNEEIQNYFRSLNMPQDYMPYISNVETYRGSWIMETAIVMAATMGTSYAVLKGIAPDMELSEIAENLTEQKDRILRRVRPRVNSEVNETLYSTANNSIRNVSHQQKRNLPPPPRSTVTTNFVIDARPLASLTPSALKSHEIHISAAVSRDSFVLENLGDKPLTDVQIGLFQSGTQRNHWSYVDSYMGRFPLVSPHQTITKSLDNFQDRHGTKFDISHGRESHVDCWVQDNHGIYLFQFFLEQE